MPTEGCRSTKEERRRRYRRGERDHPAGGETLAVGNDAKERWSNHGPNEHSGLKDPCCATGRFAVVFDYTKVDDAGP